MAISQTSLQQLQQAAHSYRKDLLKLPVIAMAATLQYMTTRPGVRYKETVFSPEFNAQLAPYQSAERTDVEGDFIPRTLETQFGACFFDFDPNQVISTIIGHRASQAGEGAKNTPSAREVVASVVKNVGKTLNAQLFKAKYDPAGTTTADLFDGFDTITDKEIEAGNISVEKGNLLELDEEITEANADKIFKKILRAMSDELRDEQAFVFCPRSVVDDYNENYLLTHNAVPYNKEYNQTCVEGSNNMLTFAPVVGKKGSKYLHITTKANMLFGCDQLSDEERVEINKYEPKKITGEIYMFAGCQFESIDPRRLLVVKLKDPNNA